MEGKELWKDRNFSVRRNKVFSDNVIECMSYSARQVNE